ncbi:MAG: o-succinylbenzoate--CoA ligase [Ignavibacteriaceae bacterium]
MNPLVDWNLNKNYSPELTAVIYKNTKLTYFQLDTGINSRVYALQQEGIRRGNHVPLISENNPDFIINTFALWRLGAIPVPVNTRLIDKEIEELLSFTGCTHAIVDKALNREIQIKSCKIISEFSLPGNEVLSSAIIPSENETAVIIYTSGSTGKPKGVEISFGNLISSALTGNTFLNHRTDDKWLTSLPFYHIGGFSIFVRALLFGASVIIPDSLSAENICKSITLHKPTLASLVSTQLLNLIESGCNPNEELRNILLGGGFVETELLKKALTSGWNVSKVYGSSETASMVTALSCKEKVKLNSAGKALSGNEIVIVDDNGKILPPGMSGEILVKGPTAAKGYLNNPEETSAKFVDGYYHSGDIGYLDDEGYLFIEARRTDLIISGGENINPLEVEKEILKHPGIIEAAVFGIDDKKWGQSVAAAIVTKNKKQITIEELKVSLKDKLSGYKIPRKLFIIDELPRNDLGKVQREKLKELLPG